MPTAPSSATKQKLAITLPTTVVDAYEERAMKLGRSVEAEIADRLIRCQNFTSLTPIYLTDEHRARLTRLMGKQPQSAEDLIALVERTAEIKVGPTVVPLDAQLLGRLKSRCFSAPLDEVIQRETLNGLMQFTGLL